MNLCGSSGGGGAALEVEPDRCHLARVDFLGAMEVDLWVQICKNNKKNKRGSKKGNKMACGGKNDRSYGYL